MRKSIALALLCLAAGANAAEPDHPDIRAVIESFRTAIIQRDKPRFLNLFVSPDLPWQGVLTDEALVELKKRDPKALKVAYDSKSNAAAFIDSIVRSKKTSEEKFSDIKIDGNGDVATVTAAYTFLSGDKPVNSGKECWLLVRTGSGWKITTLAFSADLNQEEPKPKQ
jgi:hypothetical protein